MPTNNTFRGLHHAPELLLLPNAWDAGSARLIESLGAAAIATTSAGVAWSRGYPDGDVLPIEQLLAAVREIARVVRVPLSVDIEGGYSSDPTLVAQLVTRVVDMGAVGLNIEDGDGSPDLLCAKIEAARRAAAGSGVDLFINARTDVYLRALATGDAAVEEVIGRARRYQAAGCDGIFVPILTDDRGIEAIADAVAPLPLNIMLMPGLPSNSVLHKLGVRRLSAGSAISQAALGFAGQLTKDFLAGSSDAMFAKAADYGSLNQLFKR